MNKEEYIKQLDMAVSVVKTCFVGLSCIPEIDKEIEEIKAHYIEEFKKTIEKDYQKS